MKISFFPRNRRQSFLFEGVADRLKDLGFECGFIYPRVGESSNSSFYPESEVSNKIVSGEINYLNEFKRICETYENVNRIIQSDREINYFPFYYGDKAVSRYEKIKLCCAFFICYESYIDKFKPDLIVSEMVLGILDGALFEVAKTRQIPYLGIRPSKTKEGVVICDNPYDRPIFLEKTIQALKIKDEKLLYKEAIQIVRKSVKPNALPHYMKRSGRKHRLFTLRAIRSLFRVLFFAPKSPKVSIYQHRRINAFREAIVKTWNIRGWVFNDDEISTISSKHKFFVYAAHFEPEASVQVRAFEFSDQLALIKQISRLLPPDCILIVKDHRGNQGFRKPIFYRELSHSYNVICASSKINLRELIQNSKGVITLTGRVGLEAMIDKIPVIAFGKTFWTDLKDVFKPKSPEEIRTVLTSLSRKDSSAKREAGLKSNLDLCRLLIAYEQLTYPGCFIQGADEFTSDENIENYSNALKDICSRI
ncbi:MAG: hypothetical protein P8K73_04795 [Methylophilaceae bacterium]|nr:hypothetical protein [Methylophilaceae bacterium]